MLLIAVGGLWYVNRNRQNVTNKNPNPIAINTDIAEAAKVISADGYHRGVLIRPYALGAYSKDNLLKQLQLAKELGAVDVRANLETDDNINDDFVNSAISLGLNPVIIIEPSIDNFFSNATYDYAYNYASKYAKRYKNKVNFYQLANEASGVNLKTNYPGNKTSDYDETKYAVFLKWIKGLSSGVYDNDPNAKRIVSAHWLGVGVIDKLVADGVHFEVIGWNWYDDMGDSLVKKTDDGSTLNIPDYLSKYNKEFWIIELNRHIGTYDGNYNAQSDYLSTFMINVAKDKLVNGIYIFPLTDMCEASATKDGKMGLVKLNILSGSTCELGDKKPAYSTVQQLFTNK